MAHLPALIRHQDIENRIFTIRAIQVMVDSHLPKSCSMKPKRHNWAVNTEFQAIWKSVIIPYFNYSEFATIKSLLEFRGLLNNPDFKGVEFDSFEIK